MAGRRRTERCGRPWEGLRCHMEAGHHGPCTYASATTRQMSADAWKDARHEPSLAPMRPLRLLRGDPPLPSLADQLDAIEAMLPDGAWMER